MSTFTVDPSSLEALAGTLGGICAEMDGMRTFVTGFQGRLGGRALEGEIENFCSQWHYGIGQLEQHMKNTVENLQKAAGTYAKSDADVADACKG